MGNTIRYFIITILSLTLSIVTGCAGGGTYYGDAAGLKVGGPPDWAGVVCYEKVQRKEFATYDECMEWYATEYGGDE